MIKVEIYDDNKNTLQVEGNIYTIVGEIHLALNRIYENASNTQKELLDILFEKKFYQKDGEELEKLLNETVKETDKEVETARENFEKRIKNFREKLFEEIRNNGERTDEEKKSKEKLLKKIENTKDFDELSTEELENGVAYLLGDILGGNE